MTHNHTQHMYMYMQDEFVTDSDYLQSMLHVILPLAHQFQPDIVVVSAGFDAAAGDFIGVSARQFSRRYQTI